MFDDLRQQGDKPVFSDSDEAEDKTVTQSATRRFRPSGSRRRILGMTAPQRFIISMMLLMMTCLLGAFCLLVTERVVPSFLY